MVNCLGTRAFLVVVLSGLKSLCPLPVAHRFVLKGFASDGRDLTDKETKAFLNEADKDGDGMIGIDGK